MKTLEQVKEHLATTYYDCSDKICGFIVGCALKDPKEVIKFIKEDDYVYNFDDFLEWFYDEEEEDEDGCDDCDCPLCKCFGNPLTEIPQSLIVNMLKCRADCDADKAFNDLLNFISSTDKSEKKEKPFKYQGEERDALEREREAKVQISCDMEDPYLYLCVDDKKYLDHINKRIMDIDDMLEERVDE